MTARCSLRRSNFKLPKESVRVPRLSHKRLRAEFFSVPRFFFRWERKKLQNLDFFSKTWFRHRWKNYWIRFSAILASPTSATDSFQLKLDRVRQIWKWVPLCRRRRRRHRRRRRQHRWRRRRRLHPRVRSQGQDLVFVTFIRKPNSNGSVFKECLSWTVVGQVVKRFGRLLPLTIYQSHLSLLPRRATECRRLKVDRLDKAWPQCRWEPV